MEGVAQPGRFIDGARTVITHRLEPCPSLWNTLHSPFTLPTARPEWVLSFLETTGYRPLVVSVTEAAGAIGALGVLVDRGWFQHAVQPGHNWLGEPTDFVCRAPALLRPLANRLARSRVPLNLERVPADSPTLDELREAYRGRAWLRMDDAGACPFVPLEGSPVLSTRTRSDLRRARRKAEKIGSLGFELHSPRSREEMLPLFVEALRIEDHSWKGKAGSSLARDPHHRAFFERYCTRAAEQAALRFCFLRMGEKRVATQIAVEHNDRLWLLKIGHDERFAACSPGMLLMEESLRDAAARGLRTVEFLGNRSKWSARWTSHERPMMRIRAYPYNLRGLFLLARDGAMKVAMGFRKGGAESE